MELKQASAPWWLEALRGLGVHQKQTGGKSWATVRGPSAFRQGKKKRRYRN